MRPATYNGTWVSVPVVLRHETELTSEEYISRRAWLCASLSSCPKHPKGGCGLRPWGSYSRRCPAGLRIRRWYCPQAHITFSLMPDFAATRVSTELGDIEAVAFEVERSRKDGDSFELAARSVRPDIQPQGAMRWVRRRCRWVSAALAVLVGLAPELFAGCEPSLQSVRDAMRVDCVLVRARQIAAAHLAHMPAPVGFAPLQVPHQRARKALQHKAGPDPPRATR
jgi:hypothetical protein